MTVRAEELEPGVPEEVATGLAEIRAQAQGLAGEPGDMPQRVAVLHSIFLDEQETTVGPNVREEVGAFDCPVLTRLVLKPIVRFAYFPRGRYLRFRDFGNTEERIEKAVRSYQLAERVGWDAVAANIRRYEALPEQFYADPAGYVAGLPASPAAAKD